MTIDEAIERFKYDAECNRADLDLSYAEDNEQVVEWLEELKDLRELKDTITSNAEVLEIQGYNKAIDDYMKIISKMDLRCLSCIVDCKFDKEENCSKSLLIYLAEQLKAGALND